MLWGISSFVALLLNSAVQALPQGDLADLLLPVAPGLDKPVPLTIPTTTHHTEQASTLSPIERATFAFPQPMTHTTQLTTAITGVASHPHFPPTPTPSPTPTVKTPRPPTHTPEGNDTHIGVTATSTSQDTTTSAPTRYPSPSPVVDSGPSQGHGVGWRVIGIAVIAISVVGTMILMVVFFDQWWGFLCDVCGRPRTWRERGKEELVPDWQRGSWGFRVEDDNRPAYPSFGSPPTLQTIQEEVATHTQSRKVDAGRSLPDQNTSPNHLEFPPVLVPKDNGQVYSAGRMPYGPSRRHRNQFSPPSGLVNDATAYNYHSPLSRSNTQRSTASEDAYDGLAP